MREVVQITFFALGTVNTITIPGCSRKDILQTAKDRVLELDDRLSVFKEDSEISQINQAAGRGFVKVHSDTFYLIQAAVHFSALTEGVFDITACPMVALWGIGKKNAWIPSQEEISRMRSLVDYRDILMDETACTVMLKQHGQAIDLGSIAKGYAADEVRRILLENSVTEALINLGGTVVAIGPPCTLGIQHPMKETGIPMGRLTMTNMAAVTSGSNEKYFIKDGVRYHHILDPRTGCPAHSGLLSITLIGESAMALDALTTAVFILGMQKGITLIKQFQFQAVFITDTLDVFTTDGLKNRFSFTA